MKPWDNNPKHQRTVKPWNFSTSPAGRGAKCQRDIMGRSKVEVQTAYGAQKFLGPKEVRMARTLAKAVAHSSFEQCVDAERFMKHFTPADVAAAVRRWNAHCIYVDARAEERRYCAVSRTVHDILKKVWRRQWQWRVNESALFLVGPVGLLDCRSGAISYALKVPFVIHGWCNPHCAQPDWQNTKRWWFLLGLHLPHLPFNPGCILSALHNAPVWQTAQCSKTGWAKVKWNGRDWRLVSCAVVGLALSNVAFFRPRSLVMISTTFHCFTVSNCIQLPSSTCRMRPRQGCEGIRDTIY